MLILGIETSCDETAAAVVRDGRELISSIVVSQIEKHKKWGGVIPEMASRFHLEVIDEVIKRSLDEAGLNLQEDIDAIAVTQGPGLTGSLLVGANAAKTLAWIYSKPIIPVNHLMGHIAANYIGTEIEPPLLCLLVSGGHSQIIRVDSYTQIEVIGESVDDAAGEAFDKVARLMDLPYPGGPHMDKLAKEALAIKGALTHESAETCRKAPFCSPERSEGSPRYEFKIPDVPNLDFSFSGLKTAALRLKEKLGEEIWQRDKAAIALAFQNTVAEFLYSKVAEAQRITNISTIIIAGGVAANSSVRKRFSEGFSQIYYPPLKLCTDNAAMIAAAAYHLQPSDLGFEVYSRQ